MADEDQLNDEYQFDDLDAINPSEGGDDTIPPTEDTEVPASNVAADAEKNNIKRNALIVVGAVILAMLLYKIIGSMFSEKKVTTQTSIPALTPVTPQVVQQPTPPPAVVAAPVDMKLTQKIAVLESTQQSMRTDVSAVNAQLGGINQNVNSIVAKMTELNSIIATLAAKVEQQSREIEVLTIRHEQAKKITPVVRKAVVRPTYYIQAVIPGRAWLIATNGATLTVREGTIIAGYGIVKLIDPIQGRVTTSSGQVIRFSQEDS